MLKYRIPQIVTLTPFAEVSVIYIDVLIACIFQSFLHHEVGLMFNNVFADVY